MQSSTRQVDRRRPHLQLTIPYQRLNALLEESLQDVRPMTLAIPAIPLGLGLRKVTVIPSSVRVLPAPPNHVAASVRLEIRNQEQLLTRATLIVNAVPEIIRREKDVVVAVRFQADSVNQAHPELDDQATVRISSALRNQLPRTLRKQVSPSLVAFATSYVKQYLSNEGFAAVRKTLLRRLGQETELSFKIPDVPVTEITTRTVETPEQTLVIDLHTSLPIARGLGAPKYSKPTLGAVVVRFPGSLIAESTNWAIATGLLPQRYNSKIHPRDDGKYLPVYEWVSGDRPLRIHLFRMSFPCSRVQIAARPNVRVADGEVSLSVTDGHIESIQGSTLARLGLWWKRLGAGAIEKKRTFAAKIGVGLGRRQLAARIVDATILDDELVFVLRFDVTARPPRQARIDNRAAPLAKGNTRPAGMELRAAPCR